jgi:transposase
MDDRVCRRLGGGHATYDVNAPSEIPWRHDSSRIAHRGPRSRLRAKCRIKVLFHDGTGFCIFYKRLDRGAFRVPGDEDDPAEHVTLEAHELDALLDGIDVVKRRPRRVLQ